MPTPGRLSSENRAADGDDTVLEPPQARATEEIGTAKTVVKHLEDQAAIEALATTRASRAAECRAMLVSASAMTK